MGESAAGRPNWCSFAQLLKRFLSVDNYSSCLPMLMGQREGYGLWEKKEKETGLGYFPKDVTKRSLPIV